MASLRKKLLQKLLRFFIIVFILIILILSLTLIFITATPKPVASCESTCPSPPHTDNSLALNINRSYIPWNFDNNVPLSSFQIVFKVSRLFCFYLHRSYQILTHEYPSKANIQKTIKNMMNVDINTLAWLYAGVLFLVLVAAYLGPKICLCCKIGCKVVDHALNKMMRKWTKPLRFGVFLCFCAFISSIFRREESERARQEEERRRRGEMLLVEEVFW